MFNPSSFYSVLTPTYYVTTVFGLVPFKINNQVCENSKIHLFWSIFLMLFLNISAFTSRKSSAVGVDIIAEVTNIIDIYISNSQMLFGILFGCIFRNDILNVLQQIKLFDMEMQVLLGLDLKQEYRKSKIYSVIAISVVIFWSAVNFALISYMSSYFFTIRLFGRFITDTFPYLISTFVELQFCTLLLCLKQRFGWLNKGILDISKNLENSLGQSYLGSKNRVSRPHLGTRDSLEDQVLYLMENIRINHYRLCSICRIINKACSVQVLIIIIQSLITIIVALYYTGKHIIANRNVPLSFLLYGVAMLILAIGLLLVLVLVCSSTVSEAQQAGILIHKIKILHNQKKNKYEELRLEIAFFSFQLLHHNVEFTACKMFVINETVLVWVAQTVAAYLIIVLQLGEERFY